MKKFQMCLMKISSNCKLYQKRFVQKIKIKEQPQHWKQIMLNHIMYSISLTNYHIKKRPFTTTYLVAKNVFIYFCYPAQLSQMSFLKNPNSSHIQAAPFYTCRRRKHWQFKQQAVLQFETICWTSRRQLCLPACTQMHKSWLHRCSYPTTP